MRSVRKDRGLNILQYEKQARLINSLLDGQEIRNGKPNFKSFCDLGLKLQSCWVTTHRHRSDDVDRFLISSLGHLYGVPKAKKTIIYYFVAFL